MDKDMEKIDELKKIAQNIEKIELTHLIQEIDRRFYYYLKYMSKIIRSLSIATEKIIDLTEQLGVRLMADFYLTKKVPCDSILDNYEIILDKGQEEITSIEVKPVPVPIELKINHPSGDGIPLEEGESITITNMKIYRLYITTKSTAPCKEIVIVVQGRWKK